MDKTDTEAWRAAFDERHEFDVYPDHFMTGMRNEFCAGWHAALSASQPKVLTDDLLVQLFYAAQGDITKFRIKARALLEAK
jgi:hypothetical protein